MSIKHFHALSNKRKTIFLEEPEKFTAKEKLDGSNFIFGMTDGKLWTARKSTTQRFYSSTEWTDQMWTQNFRITHEALEQPPVIEYLRAIAGNDFTAHCELLSPLYPNTIMYYTDVTSLVIYDGPQIPELRWVHKSNVATSMDGITTASDLCTFDFVLSNLIDSEICIDSLVYECEHLDSEKIPQFLIDSIVHQVSDYGNTRPEGYVFTHRDGWRFKVVDDVWFTQQNKINYQVRKLLFKTPGQKSNSLMDVYTRNIANGISRKDAASITLAELTTIHSYHLQNLPLITDPRAHRRNLEAMASLRQQLISEAGWVDERSRM